MLELLLRERRFPAREIVPFASERSIGRELEEAWSCADSATRRSRASTSRSSPPAAPPPASGRRALRGRRGGRRQLVALAHGGRSARRRRGQPRGSGEPPRDHRQPELLDHADGRRAQAARGRSRDRAARDQHLPGRLGHRHASCRELLDQSHALLHEREIAPPSEYAHQIASTCSPHAGSFRRGRGSHRRGAQADERDAQDPRRPVDPRQRHLRSRPRGHRALGGGERADTRAALARARPRAAERGTRGHGARQTRQAPATRSQSTPRARTAYT